MEQKLLFFDIDGTLIEDRTGKIPDSAVQAVRAAREQGHLAFVNTGRTRASIPKVVTDIGFDGFVCGCGTHIFLGEEELLAVRISNELCREVAQKVRSYQVPVFYEAADAIYFDRQVPDEEGWIAHAEKSFQLQGRDIEEVLNSREKVFDKLLVVLKPSEKSEELKEYLSQYFLCIDRSHNIYEVTQKNCSKATGIRFLCERLGKSLKDCFVFGDSENDRAMLEAVPNSVAMGNGEEAIKKCCSYVTRPVEEDGIYEAMKHFGLIK